MTDRMEATSRLQRARTIGLIVVVLWAVLLAKVGSGVVIGISDLVDRVRALPDLRITGDSADDYINWSILPLALGKVLGADTVWSFSFLQFVVLIGGSTFVLVNAARRNGALALNATLALFATLAPAWALFAMGSYDQMLLVLLLAAAIVDTRVAACALGVLLGLTHAEASVVVLLGLLALSAIEVGPRVVVRLWTLGGVLFSRLVLTIWFRAAGQSSDRFTFINEYGWQKLAGYLWDTWPYVIWSAAAGGWLIIGGTLALRRSRRLTIVVSGILLFNLAMTAITADQSRIIMLTTFPMVVVLACFTPRADDSPTVVQVSSYLRYGGALVGLLAPLTLSWIGEVLVADHPFHIGW